MEAFCFDQACTHFGQSIEAAMNDVKAKNERQRRGKAHNVLLRMLGEAPKFRGIEALGGAKKSEPEDRPEPPFRME